MIKNVAILLSISILTSLLTYEYAFVKAYAIGLQIVGRPMYECISVIKQIDAKCNKLKKE